MAKAQIEVKPRIVVRGVRAMGPGKADLLDCIAQSGSISAAAKRMNMSYSRAWQLVDAMNCEFRTPLVETATGGKSGGGAAITPLGREALALYLELQKQLHAQAAPFRGAFERLLK